MRAHGSAERRSGIDNDDARLAGDTGLGELRRHFGRDLDPGEAGADHDHGRARRGGLALAERGKVFVEPQRGLIGIDIKGVRSEA